MDLQVKWFGTGLLLQFIQTLNLQHVIMVSQTTSSAVLELKYS